MLAQDGQSLHMEFHWTCHLHYYGVFSIYWPFHGLFLILCGTYMSACERMLNACVRWKNKKENISVQCETVSPSLKSNWQNPLLQKHWAAFVSSVLFNRLQAIDFCLDRFSLGRPSQCGLQRGSEMLLLTFFFFSLDWIVLIRCSFFNVALKHNISLKWYSAGRFRATGSRQPLGMSMEKK